MQTQMLMKKPAQFPVNELLDENERIYKGWASVEIKDAHGDLLPMSVFKKIMPLIIDRGGVILDSHSNRHTGKIINYEFKTNEEAGKEGLYLTVKNYKGYQHDDMIWEKIKNGTYTGFSFGGMSIGQPTMKFETGMDVTKILNEFEGFEFSNVETPANSASVFTEINYLAKSDGQSEDQAEEEIAREEPNMGQSNELLSKAKALRSHFEDLQNAPNNYIRKILRIAFEAGLSEKFKYMRPINNIMPEQFGQQNAPAQPAMDNGADARIAKLEQAVSEILQMLQSNSPQMKSKEDSSCEEEDVKKEEDVSEDVTLPKATEEKIQSQAPASGEKSDSVKIMEKELTEVKKSLNEIKQFMQDNKVSTPKPIAENANIQKSVELQRPKNFKDAHALVRKLR